MGGRGLSNTPSIGTSSLSHGSCHRSGNMWTGPQQSPCPTKFVKSFTCPSVPTGNCKQSARGEQELLCSDWRLWACWRAWSPQRVRECESEWASEWVETFLQVKFHNHHIHNCPIWDDLWGSGSQNGGRVPLGRHRVIAEGSQQGNLIYFFKSILIYIYIFWFIYNTLVFIIYMYVNI